jgi:hypothetical protein
MSQGDWTGGFVTTDGLKHSFYEIAGARFVQGRHETNSIGGWSRLNSRLICGVTRRSPIR